MWQDDRDLQELTLENRLDCFIRALEQLELDNGYALRHFVMVLLILLPQIELSRYHFEDETMYSTSTTTMHVYLPK